MDALTDLPSLPPAQSATPRSSDGPIGAHRDAFLAHRRAASFTAAEPRLGVTIPWVLVSCDATEGTVEGIIVGGDWDGDLKQWDFDSTFAVFDAYDREGGSFTRVHGWMFGKDDIEVLGTLAGEAP